MTEQSKVFANELNWISDIKKRTWCAAMLDALPDYFYEVAASSTGKYHPEYALGEGGLVRHTKAAVTIAHDLLGLEMYGKYMPNERDNILCALLLHDGLKHGEDGGKYTVFSHPLDIVRFLRKQEQFRDYITDKDFEQICDGISSHMGQWVTDKRHPSVVLPKPMTSMQKFIHQCDYLASRRYIEIAFDKINYTGDRV